LQHSDFSAFIRIPGVLEKYEGLKIEPKKLARNSEIAEHKGAYNRVYV
jgi:hypothetical protein